MVSVLLMIDGGHVLSAAGRATGVGGRRCAGAFDVPKLISGLRALIPAAADLVGTFWYDGVPPAGESRDLREVRERSPATTVVALPMRGGRQRHVEAAMLRDASDAVSRQGVRCLYLAADPRRHSVTVQTVQDAGCDVVLMGVSDGERTPAERIWLRRPEVLRALSSEVRRPPGSRPASSAYQRPDVHSSPVRLPLPTRETR